MGAYHCTSNEQEHKIVWHAGQEQDTIFHLRVTVCRKQGSHCHNEGLVLGTNYKKAENVFQWPTMCTDRKQPFNLSNAHAHVYYLLIGESKNDS